MLAAVLYFLLFFLIGYLKLQRNFCWLSLNPASELYLNFQLPVIIGVFSGVSY